jgi:nitrogen regulatory protein P-II 1
MNVADVRGTGNSPERAAFFGGESHLVALPIRARIEVVIPDSLEQEVVQAIVEQAHTGEPGDGKIFVEVIEEVVRVRTGDRGEAAL